MFTIPLPDVVEMHGSIGLAAFEAAQDLQARRIALKEADLPMWPEDRNDDYWAGSGLTSERMSPEMRQRIATLSLI